MADTSLLVDVELGSSKIGPALASLEKTIVNSLKDGFKEIGDLLATALTKTNTKPATNKIVSEIQSAITSIKLDKLKGVAIDPANLNKLKTDVNNALAGGKITNQQAVSLLSALDGVGKTTGKKISDDIIKEAKQGGTTFGQLFSAGLLSGLALDTIKSTLSSVFNFGKGFFEVSSQMEDFRASFGALVGDAQKGGKLLSNIYDMSAKTPFETTELANAGQLLMQYNVAQEDVLGTLQKLGDASGGNASKMQSLALAYGQVNAAGKTTMGDINQMINAGFNPLNVIAQKTGMTMGELRKQVESGNISFQNISDAFTIATSAGGQFYGMMEAKSQTVSGRLSTLRDTIKTVGMAVMGVSTSGEIIKGGLFDVISKGIDEVSTKLGSINWASIGQTVATGLATLTTIITPFFTNIQLAFQMAFAGVDLTLVGQSIMSVFTIITTTVLSLFTTLTQITSPFIQLLLTSIPYIAQGFILVVGPIGILIGYVGSLVSQFQGFLTQIGFFNTVAPVIGTIIGVIAGIIFIQMVGAFIAWTVAAVSAAFSTVAAMSPVIAVIATIIGVLALLLTAWNENWGGIREITANAITGIGQFLQTGFQAILDFAGAFFSGLVIGFSNMLSFITDNVSNGLTTIATVFSDVFYGIEDIVNGFMDVFSGLLSMDLGKIVQGAGKILGGLVGLTATPVKAVAKLVQDGINNIIKMINGVIDNPIVKEVLSKMGMTVGNLQEVDFVSGLESSISGAQGALQGNSGDYQKTFEKRKGEKKAITDMIKGSGDGIKQGLDGASKSITSGIDNAKNTLKSGAMNLGKGMEEFGKNKENFKPIDVQGMIQKGMGEVQKNNPITKMQEEMAKKQDETKKKAEEDQKKQQQEGAKAAEERLKQFQGQGAKGASKSGGGGKTETEKEMEKQQKEQEKIMKDAQKEQEKQANEKQKQAEQRAKDEANSQKEIERLKVANIKNDDDRQKANLDLQAKEDLANFKGNALQKAEFAKLLEENIAKQKAEIDKKAAEQNQKATEKQQKELAKNTQTIKNTDGLKPVGEKIGQSLADGISSKQGEVAKSANSLVSKVEDTGKTIQESLIDSSKFGAIGTASFGNNPCADCEEKLAAAEEKANPTTTPPVATPPVPPPTPPETTNEAMTGDATATVGGDESKDKEKVDEMKKPFTEELPKGIEEAKGPISDAISSLETHIVDLTNQMNENFIKIFTELGANIPKSMVNGIRKNQRIVFSDIAGLSNSALEAVGAEIAGRKEGIYGRANSISSPLEGEMELARNFKAVLNKIGNQSQETITNQSRDVNINTMNIQDNSQANSFMNMLSSFQAVG